MICFITTKTENFQKRGYTTNFKLTEAQRNKIKSLQVDSDKDQARKTKVIQKVSKHVDVRKLTFNCDSFYTPHFREKLALKLGTPEAFLKLNKKAQERKAISISKNYFRDRSWKSLLIQQKFNKKVPSSLFATEFYRYQARLRLWLFLQKNEEKTNFRSRAKRHGLSIGENRIYHLYNSLLSLLMDQKFLNEKDFNFLFQNKSFFKDTVIPVFESKELFLILIQKATEMCYSNLRSNLLTIENISPNAFLEMSNKWGFAEESKLNLSLFIFQDIFRVKLLNILLVNILDTVLDKQGYTDRNKDDILNFLTKKLTEVVKGAWNEKHSMFFIHNDLSYIAEDYLANLRENFFMEQKIRFSDGPGSDNSMKERILLFVPVKISELEIVSHHLPDICEPHDYGLDQLDAFMISKDSNDTSQSIPSARALRALNLSQKKKFKVNLNTVKILKDFDSLPWSKTKNMDLPFPTEAVIERLKEKTEKLNCFKQSKTTSLLSSLFLKNALRIEKREKNFKDIKNGGDGSDVFLFFQEFNKKAEKKLKTILFLSKIDVIFQKVFGGFLKEKSTCIAKRQQFLTFLEIAPLYAGFPLFFRNLFDFRFRVYQLNFLFSKTTGFYKYLVSNFKSLKLTPMGFYYFLEAYYSGNKELLTKFHDTVQKPLKSSSV